MVQLLIMYFVIFVSVTNAVFIAIISFGLNSGAYIAEIMRAGIEDECITAPGCDTDRVRRRMGMVFQHFNLFPHLNIMKKHHAGSGHAENHDAGRGGCVSVQSQKYYKPDILV